MTNKGIIFYRNKNGREVAVYRRMIDEMLAVQLVYKSGERFDWEYGEKETEIAFC